MLSLENAGLPNWAVIVIVIVSLIVLFLLGGLVFFLIYKKKYPKAVAEMKKLDEYEINRGNKVLETVTRLETHGFKYDKKAHEVLQKGIDDMDDLTPRGRSEYKDMVDFMAFYLAKIHKEDRRLGKYITDEEGKEFENYHLESSEKYRQYNRKAASVNAFRNMWNVKIFLKISKDQGDDLPSF